jgi:uncharacterized phage-associated protein
MMIGGSDSQSSIDKEGTGVATRRRTSGKMEFTFDFEKAKEAIVYLATKVPKGMSKYIACKLLFLADRYHLVRYGRPVTGDLYCALPHGPVPTTILNLLSGLVGEAETSEQVSALRSVLAVNRSYSNPRISARNPLKQERLSKSDIEALDETIERHGGKSFEELKALTHETLAWQNAWAKRGRKNSAPMAFEDFFEEDPDALVGVLEEAIEDSELRRAFPAR